MTSLRWTPCRCRRLWAVFLVLWFSAPWQASATHRSFVAHLSSTSDGPAVATFTLVSPDESLESALWELESSRPIRRLFIADSVLPSAAPVEVICLLPAEQAMGTSYEVVDVPDTPTDNRGEEGRDYRYRGSFTTSDVDNDPHRGYSLPFLIERVSFGGIFIIGEGTEQYVGRLMDVSSPPQDEIEVPSVRTLNDNAMETTATP